MVSPGGASVLPWTHQSPNTKWHLDQFSCFSADHCRVSKYLTTLGQPFPLRIAPSHGGSGPHVTSFLGPTQVLNPNGIWTGSVFARLTTVTYYAKAVTRGVFWVFDHPQNFWQKFDAQKCRLKHKPKLHLAS